MIHSWLKKNITWYRKWHQKAYASPLHFCIFIFAAGVDFYYVYQLQMVVKLLY